MSPKLLPIRKRNIVPLSKDRAAAAKVLAAVKAKLAAMDAKPIRATASNFYV